MKKRLFCLKGMLMPALIVCGQSLHIGDSLPPLIIHHILNYPAPSINTYALRGKAVLLNFFEIYCSGCVQKLSALDSLQRQFGNRLQIILVTQKGNANTIQRFFASNKKRFATKLPIIIEDTALHRLFPHEIISHLVWINASGKVAAITGSREVTADNIEQLTEGHSLLLALKSDAMGFDYHQPFPLVYYSGLSGAMAGVASTSSETVDSSKGTVLCNHYNVPIGFLLGRAYNNGFTISEKLATGRVDLLNAQSPEYCFSSCLPMTLSSAARLAIEGESIQYWLKVLLGIRITKVRQLHASLVLTASGPAPHLLSSSKSEYVNTLDEQAKQLFHAPFSDFIWYLNARVKGIPIVVDESGIDAALLIDLHLGAHAFDSVTALQSAVARYGLQLAPCTREIDVFVITSSFISNQNLRL